MPRKYRSRRLFDFIQPFSQSVTGAVRSWGAGTGRSRRQAAAHAGQGEEILRHMGSLVDSMTTGIVSLDGNGNVRVFNAAAETLFALPRAVVIGRSLAEVGKIMSFDDHSARALWERLSDAVWAAGAALDLEYDLTLKNGTRRVISFSVYPLGRLAWSVGNGVVIMLEDITRKKEMEDQISDARKRLQAVFDGITDGIQVVDCDFRITAVNKSMTALLSRHIKLGEHCYEACGFNAAVCVDCPALETFRSGQPASITKRLRHQKHPVFSTAGERVAEISTFPLLDRGGRVVQVVEYIKDVTERIGLAERLEHSRRLAELGEMAARVAHEVRNPLNAITGAAHYLSTEFPEEDTIQKFTSLIKRQSSRVDQVASDILNASKPLRLNKTSVNIHAVLEQAMSSLCEQIYCLGIRVESGLADDVLSIQADELQIEQALHNILKNAIEAMPDGGTLRIGARTAGDGGWVEISVQDTGPGIPEGEWEKIFQSFYTTKPKGTGLGLTIVQGVLKNHNGKIFVGRPEGGGTRVVVCLPVQPISEKNKTVCDQIQCPGSKIGELSKMR